MFRLNLVILMPISQRCLHNDRIGITLRPYWSVYYVVGKPVMYTLPLVICLTFHGFVMLVLVLILIVLLDSLDNSSESCFFVHFQYMCRICILNMKRLIKGKITVLFLISLYLTNSQYYRLAYTKDTITRFHALLISLVVTTDHN